jgi:hypothetical protein
MNIEIQLLLWVLAAFAIGCIGLIAAERASRGGSSLWDTAIGSISAEIALFAFYIGLPFAAVIAGALSIDLLGLGASWSDGRHIAGFTADEWLRGTLIAAAVALFVLMALRLSTRDAEHTPLHHEGTFQNARNAFYEQVHWAFYRAPFILLLNDAVLGVAAGIGFIALEWLAHALIQRRTTRSRARWWVMVCCLLAGAALFLLTRNLWLMLAADLVIRIGSERLMTPAQAIG